MRLGGRRRRRPKCVFLSLNGASTSSDIPTLLLPGLNIFLTQVSNPKMSLVWDYPNCSKAVYLSYRASSLSSSLYMGGLRSKPFLLLVGSFFIHGGMCSPTGSPSLSSVVVDAAPVGAGGSCRFLVGSKVAPKICSSCQRMRDAKPPSHRDSCLSCCSCLQRK